MTLPRHLIRALHRLHLRSRRQVQEFLAGAYHSVFKGSGLTFEEVREYQPGDDIRLIDWNVTARMGTPFVKRYVEEREQTLWLLVDFSRSLSFGTGEWTKRAVAVEVAALLGLSALLNRDRTGLISFTDRMERVFPASKGLPHALKLLRYLSIAEPSGSGTDLALALDLFNKIQKRRAIVFLISDFLDPNERIEKPLRIAARRHDLTLVRILDRGETKPLPFGLWWLEDAETGVRHLIDARSARSDESWDATVQQDLMRYERWATEEPLHVLNLSTDGRHVAALIDHFRERMRRAGSQRR